MDARLDPECEGAKDLVHKHAEQRILLVGGPGGQLASIVDTTQEKQLRDHLVACARCRHFDPACPECGFDTKRERHGWRCSKQASTWQEWLPWNWRARHAPPKPRGWESVTPAAGRSVPVREPQPHVAPTPAARSPAARAASPPPATRKPARPPATGKPSPTPMVAAYNTLGLTSAATPEQVRSAFREKARSWG